MKFHLLIMLIIYFPFMVHADPGKDKGKCKKHPDKIHGIEEFVFMLPSPSRDETCKEYKAYRHTVVNFYKWYLDNETKILIGLSQANKEKDLIPPFNISYQSLQDYFEFIQNKYPDWIEGIAPANTGTPATFDFSNLAK